METNTDIPQKKTCINPVKNPDKTQTLKSEKAENNLKTT